MKTGYSILLGEYVGAGEVAHADTIGFQIVCPCCKDPVFKVIRETTNSISEFFSHHHKPKDLAAECELRVAGISQSAQDAANAVSRGQSLKAFQGVLRQALALDGSYKGDDHVVSAHAKLRAHHGINYFLSVQAEEFIGGDMAASAPKLADYFLAGLAEAGLEMQTSFSIGVQRRIAIDLVRHLSAPHSTKSRDFVIAHAYLVERMNYLSADGTPMGDDPRIRRHVDFFRRIERMDGFQTRQHILDQSKTNPQDIGMVLHGYKITLVGALMRLPYREMLANHVLGRPLLHGIGRAEPGMPLGLVESAVGTRYKAGAPGTSA